MPGASADTATLLAFDDVEAFNMGGDSEVWLKIQPTVTGVYKFNLTGSGGGLPYCDVYRVDGAVGATYYDNWVGWCGDYGTDEEVSGIGLYAGEEYLIAFYDWSFGSSSFDYTIEVNDDVGPANSHVANAELIPGGIAVEVPGTTVNGGQFEEEFNDYDGSQMPIVWYKVEIGGPGVFSYGIESHTPGWFPYVDLFHEDGSPVLTFSDLDPDIGSEEAGDGTETPPARLYDQSGTPGSSAGDLSPLEGGEVFYLAVQGWDMEDWAEQGSFTLTVSSPPEAVCFDAVDYISGSGTVSVVSGAVRETQVFYGARIANAPYTAWISDLTPTLEIPGADILDGQGPGFYAVSVKTKNADAVNAHGGMKRNGQPLWPGVFLDTDTSSTLYTNFLTMPAGADPYQEDLTNDVDTGFTQSLNMVWYLPVAADDEIEIIVVGGGEQVGPASIDITQVCFQRILDAQPGQPYPLLDVPDFPLGMVLGDLSTAAGKFGPIDELLGSGTAPTYANGDYEGFDICVTNDGTLWLVLNLEASTTSGTRYIGPALLKWNGSSWSVISNDIAGFGFKRSQRGGAAGQNSAPYGISMDTDGEDLWICYGEDLGVAAIGGFRSTGARVKKYDVSANSFSNVGGLVVGNTTRISLRAETGAFESSVHIKLAPDGTPWLGFCDWYDEGKAFVPPTSPDPPLYFDTPRPAFAAKWTGSTWDVQRLPPPEWWQGEHTDAEADTVSYEAESIQVGGGSGSLLGETTVTTTQTTYAIDHLHVTPPAGKYAIWIRGAASAASHTLAARVRIDGVDAYGSSDDLLFSVTSTTFTMGKGDFWVELDGTQQLEISIRRASGAGTIHVDRIDLVPAWVMVQNSPNSWGPWYVPFVEDAQFHVQLAFPDGNDPVAIYTTASIRYTDDEDAVQPPDPGMKENPWDLGYVPPGTHWGNYAYLFQLVVYSRFNGTTWDRLWQGTTDEHLPNYHAAKTPYESFGFAMPLGTFQQGLALQTDGAGNTYAAMCCGLNTNGGAEFILFKCGEEGMEYVGERPPGIIGGNGYPEFGYSWLQWGWDIHPHSLLLLDGDIFIGYAISGVPGNFEDGVAVYAPNGIGDWFLAAENNLPIGYNDIEPPGPVLAASPDGSKVYIASFAYIADLATIPDPSTFGVWECTVIPDAKVPLIPVELAGDVNMNYRWSGDRRRSGVTRFHR